MRPVKGVPGLEGHDVRVAVAGQAGARLRWGLPQGGEVVVRRSPQHPQRAGYVDPSPAVHLRHEGVPYVTGTEYMVSRLLQVPLVRLLYCHDSQQLVTRIAQRDVTVEFDGRRIVDRQCHRYRKERAVAEPHLADRSPVVVLPHEPVKGRERSCREELKVAGRAVRQLDAGKAAGAGLQIDSLVLRDDQVDQPSTVGAK